ncbi:MAG: hypothetical protein R3Y06_03295 [Faecalibacterium sp.]
MKNPLTQNTVRSYLAVIAIILIGVSVALFKYAMFGTDPFQCFMSGMAIVLSFWSFSLMYFVVSVLQFIAMYIWGRKYIGFATFVNIFCLGTIIEYSGNFLSYCLGEQGFAARMIIFLCGILLLMFSSALYFTADKGVSTYDFIALTMADKKVASFRLCRIFTDSVCVIVGLLCGIGFGAGVGVGTIITAFCMGPVIALLREKLTDPFLAKFPEQVAVQGDK